MEYDKRLKELKSIVALKGAELCHQTLFTAKIIAEDLLNNPSNEEILKVYNNLVDSEREVGLMLKLSEQKKAETFEEVWKNKGLA